METTERKKHWETVFQTKDTTKVSWYQPVPETSLKLIEKLNLSKSARIIEVGSGDSFLGDFLIEKGYSEITLLDISEKALETVKNRFASKKHRVRFLAGDVVSFSTFEKYDLWHDRAVFHFLTDENDIRKYVENVSEHLVTGGYLVLGAFSDKGPEMCSGLKVQQYSEKLLVDKFCDNFRKIECFTENHETPSHSIQNFLFCIFRKI